MEHNQLRLDAGENVWFKRQLEYIDRTLYEAVYPDNMARQLIPTQPGIPDWARVYTWRMFDRFGKAKIVANMADDIPRADRSGQEESKVIKPLASSYGWDIFEIKASAQTNTPLDQLKAQASRFAIEAEIDSILAVGNAAHNLQGIFNLSNTQTVTLTTKTGGGVAWSATATAQEIAADVFAMPVKAMVAMKASGGPVFQKFTIIIPIDSYAKIMSMQMSAGSDTTVLQYVKRNSPWIDDIIPWHYATGAGAGGTNRMVAYPKNPMVVAGVVPMEFTTMPAEQRNLEYVVNALATCGGVVVRYPVAVVYADGL